MRKWIALTLLLSSCGPTDTALPTSFVVASTTSTQDSGFLDAMAPEFEKANPGLRAKVIAVGSGEAMELGRRGDADVLLAHSPKDEERFMQEGRGILREPVMSNDFVIAGPASDPAAIRNTTDAAAALLRIAQSGKPFVSRGDESGTHKREIDLWAETEVSFDGSWYLESGQGMAESLMIASEKAAYVLTDAATLTVMGGKINIISLFSGDSLLINRYSVIPVKNARRQKAAVDFARWLTGPLGQKFIRNFGRKEHGAPLFAPASEHPDSARES